MVAVPGDIAFATSDEVVVMAADVEDGAVASEEKVADFVVATVTEEVGVAVAGEEVTVAGYCSRRGCGRYC